MAHPSLDDFIGPRLRGVTNGRGFALAAAFGLLGGCVGVVAPGEEPSGGEVSGEESSTPPGSGVGVPWVESPATPTPGLSVCEDGSCLADPPPLGGQSEEETGDIRQVPIVVGYGPGRTILSCDGGESWTANQADPDVPETGFVSHSDYRVNDLEYYEGRFYYLEGWYGDRGGSRVWVSEDGIHWDSNEIGYNAWGMAVGRDSIAAGSKWFNLSFDDGATWSQTARIQPGKVRMGTFREPRENLERFISLSNNPTDSSLNFFYSDDGGLSWSPAQSYPDVFCTGPLVFADDLILTFRGSSVCHSPDGGLTWQTSVSSSSDKIATILWDGTRFLRYHEYNREDRANPTRTSPDGVTWIDGPSLSLPEGWGLRGKVRFHYDPATGNYLGTLDGRFMISRDGYGYEWVSVPEDQLEGRNILLFESGEVQVTSSHPCYGSSGA